METLERLENGEYLYENVQYNIKIQGQLSHIYIAMREAGISHAEIGLALEQMEVRGNNTAHFGVGGHFIFTSNRSCLSAA